MQSLLLKCFRSPLYFAESFRQPREEFTSTFRYLLSELLPYLKRSSMYAVAIEACTISSTFLAMSIIEAGVTVPRVLAMSALYLIGALLTATLASKNYTILDSIEGTGRERIAYVVSKKLYRLEDETIRYYGRGKLKNLLDGDSMAVASFFWSLFFGIIPALNGILFLAPAAVMVGGKAILPAILLSPLAVIITLWSTRFQRPIEFELKQAEDSLLEVIDRWVQNMRLVRSMCWSSDLKNEIAKNASALFHLEVKKDAISVGVHTLSTSWWVVATALYLATAFLLGSPVELSGAFGGIWLLCHFSTRLNLLPHVISNYSAASVGMRRIDEFMSLKEESQANSAGKGAIKTITLRGVEVVIGERRILQIDNLTLATDEATLITGPVGAGKSTLLKVLSAEILPTHGEIWGTTENGETVALTTPEGRALLRSTVAYQPQEPFTAQARLSFNVSLVDESGLSTIDEALKKSELLPDLAVFNNEDILLGEHGVNLSGGQKQRVTLARAFHSGRPLMILDDPFSALDANTQLAIANNLKGFKGIFIATHHAHLITFANREVVLKDGRVVEEIQGVE